MHFLATVSKTSCASTSKQHLMSAIASQRGKTRSTRNNAEAGSLYCRLIGRAESSEDSSSPVLFADETERVPSSEDSRELDSCRKWPSVGRQRVGFYRGQSRRRRDARALLTRISLDGHIARPPLVSVSTVTSPNEAPVQNGRGWKPSWRWSRVALLLPLRLILPAL